ncbi:MAG: hypothetical protein AB1896_22970, partial [Thermodesulfobacteriota bacterium]
MILVDDESPRWLRELNRFLPLKSLLFVEGNVMDLVSFPVRREGSAEVYWTDDYLSGFLLRYLTSAGYKVVGFLDPVDGLSFPDADMEARYNELSRGASRESGLTVAPDGPTPPPPSKTPGPPPPAGGARTMDLGAVLDGLRAAVANTQVPAAFVFNLASRLITSPGNVSPAERTLFTKVLKASLESADVFAPDGRLFKNVLLLVCDKLNDLPPFLYVNN